MAKNCLLFQRLPTQIRAKEGSKYTILQFYNMKYLYVLVNTKCKYECSFTDCKLLQNVQLD